MVPLEAAEALSRGFAEHTDAANRRRALVHLLRDKLQHLGLTIEHRRGFGYRLRGEIHLRPMETVL